NNLEMQPLYILEMGKPGSSYAFEIAQKIGLPPQVLASAKNKVGVQQKKVDTLLVDLERDKKELMDSRVAIEKKERRVKAQLEDNEKLKSYLEENKKAIIKDARQEAQNIIRNANKLIENTISEIKGNQADKEKTNALRQNLQQELKKHELKEKAAPQQAAEKAELKAGDWVKFLDSETVAQVIDVAKGNVILAMGDLRSVVKQNRVQKISNKAVPKEIRRSSYTSGLTESISQFSPELDLRGKRGEEALYEIEKHLDRAIMMGLPSLKIIHGRGDGILRKLIRDYLRKYSQVNRMEDEHADRGGDGITYVYLN
ncbi:MAG TPA: Smr/MutS family protein, partial [Flavisolibacter sp.]|nr:Smr/MutS family protein [Flavisolibacter sp.]